MRGPHDLGRNAFTLIELLVVILIIAILMALVSAAVVNMLGKGPEVKSVTELRQLEVALAAMHSDFKLRTPPPSLLFLSKDQAGYDPTNGLPYPDLRKSSRAFLQKMFPRMTWSNNMGWDLPILDSAAGTKSVILEGDQVLVFLLGGPDGTSGFSTSAAAPWDLTTPTRKGPYFEFDKARLKVLPAETSAATISRSTTALSYLDAFNSSEQAPYLFFSSGSRPNGYNANISNPPNASDYGSDCKALATPAVAGLTGGVFPYHSPAAAALKKYFKPNDFQIICAGADGKFGAGGQFDPANPDLGSLKTGRDDLTNFHSGRLEAAE